LRSGGGRITRCGNPGATTHAHLAMWERLYRTSENAHN
jgi:hypothetical protein